MKVFYNIGFLTSENWYSYYFSDTFVDCHSSSSIEDVCTVHNEKQTSSILTLLGFLYLIDINWYTDVYKCM